MTLETFKTTLVLASGLSRDALQTYFGMGIYFAVALFGRKSPSSIVPLLFVLAAALLNESFDYWKDLRLYGHWRWHTALLDVISVTFWPTAIMLMCRFGIVLRKQ